MFLNYLLTALFGLLLVGVVLVILFENGDPGRKAAWLMIIAVLPVLGLVLYLMIGIDYRQHWRDHFFHRNRPDTQERPADAWLKEVPEGEGAPGTVREKYRGLAVLLSSGGADGVTDGNDVEIITEGKRKYDLLVRDLLLAERFIHVEYYLFGKDPWSDRIRDILMQKARAGVKVRFIHENIVNFDITGRYWKEMRKAGIEVLPFSSLRRNLLHFVTLLNYRDHRKIVVIDGRTGYTGGMNIKARYFEKWKDVHLRITGKGVASLQRSFLHTWYAAGGKLEPACGYYFPDTFRPEEPLPGPDPSQRPAVPAAEGTVIPLDELHGVPLQIVPDEADNRWPITQMGYVRAINLAARYIWFQTPYFVPPEPVIEALKAAALSGVDVRLMLPYKADTRFLGPVNHSYFSECLAAGIRIFRWRGGVFNHAKTFVSDDYLTQVGSSNIDFRSFELNHEINTFLYDEGTALQYKAVFLKDQEESEEVRLEEWVRRPMYRKLVERILRLLAPLL